MRARAMRARVGRGRTRAPPRPRRRRRAQAHGRRRPSSRRPVFAAGGREAAGLEAAQRLDRAHEGASAHRQHGGQQRAAHCMCWADTAVVLVLKYEVVGEAILPLLTSLLHASRWRPQAHGAVRLDVDEQAVATRVERAAWIRLGHPTDRAGARATPARHHLCRHTAGLATRLNNEYAATAVVVASHLCERPRSEPRCEPRASPPPSSSTRRAAAAHARGHRRRPNPQRSLVQTRP